MRYALIILLTTLFACSPFKFRTVQPADNLEVVVPRGFSRSEATKDPTGNPTWVYHYGSGMRFYVTRLETLTPEWIDTARHVPQLHGNGALSYKWMEPGPLYNREVRLKNYRFGYTKVPMRWEIRFDSAVNHIRDRSF